MAIISQDQDQATIRAYLLGRLSPEEQEKIEERLMVEDDLFQELEILKGELIEEYRAGGLSEQEHQSFEHGFLASKEGRRGQEFAVLIEGLGCSSPVPQPLTLIERLVSLFRQPQWAVAGMASAALLVIIAVVGVRSLQQPPKFIAITLTNSAINRAAGDTQYTTVTVPRDASELRISLMLLQPGTPGAHYRVKLYNRREETTFEPSGQEANSVTVVIPTRQVPPGPYALRIYEIKADGIEQQIRGEYFFITQ